MTTPNLLSPVAVERYWETRHRQHSTLRSGGHIGLDDASNEIFYLSRLGKLVDIIGDRTSETEPMYVLDAGCGKGYFARALRKCGFRVDGIDASDHAIAECRNVDPSGRYEVTSLSGWRSPYLYDVIYSIDVLFHILDTSEWERSIKNLASLTRLGGKLILTDEQVDQPRSPGRYILHRPQVQYRRILESFGFRLNEFLPYRFLDNHIGFFVFTRTY